MSGVYEGLTVIELADRRNQWAGKLLSDGGARVMQIERTRPSTQTSTMVLVPLDRIESFSTEPMLAQGRTAFQPVRGR